MIAKKRYGQNFILNGHLLSSLVDKINLPDNCTVLEVGAGTGSLTVELAKRARDVVTIEIDKDLELALRANLSDFINVEIIIGDALQIDWAALSHMAADAQCAPLQVNGRCFVSNLPYYITTPLMYKAIRSVPVFNIIACMVQKEVADKIKSPHGGDGYGPLSVWAQGIYNIETAAALPPSAFTPPPTVESEFIILRKKQNPAFILSDYGALERLVNAAFSSRRKTILNNLKRIGMTAEQLHLASIPTSSRAEQLRPEDFARVARAAECRPYKATCNPSP